MLRARVATALTSAQTQKCNIPKDEQLAFKALQQKIKTDIVVLPADKGNCTVIMDLIDYDGKAMTLLNTEAYVIVPEDPTESIEGKVQRAWRALKDKYKIPYNLYMKIYPSGCNISRFYGMPKIHKENSPLRPIVSSCTWPTHKLAEHLAKILKPLAGTTDSYIKNSSHFAEEIKMQTINEDEELVSFDVENMYGNINVKKALEITGEYLRNDPSLNDRTPFNVKEILKLLGLCLNNTFFSYKEVIYKQVKGLSMGSPVSPIVADLFMEKWEQNALDCCPIDFKPRLWKRFKDDTFAIVNKGKSEDLKIHLNKQDHDINVTSEVEKDGVISHLDCYVVRGTNGQLSTKVYRKPTHTNQYLNSKSNHPASSKRAVIYALMDRADTIPSTDEWKSEEKATVRRALKMNGYSNQFINKTLSKRSAKPRNEENKPKATVRIPYIKGLSEKISRILKDFNIRGVMKTQTLKDSLSRPKDKIKFEDRTGVIYQIPCNDCSKVYIGETKRRLAVRLAEHKESCTDITKHEKSAIGEHRYETDHQPNWEGVKILDSQEKLKNRKVLETLYIREYDTINRNTGEEIDKIWFKVLQHGNATYERTSDTG